ncbi:MAG: hypothetical protein JSR80_04410 [Verrucomicrobia bacterium]|nr:hypothetical protein [Verrucomicrobiota bacterium]
MENAQQTPGFLSWLNVCGRGKPTETKEGIEKTEEETPLEVKKSKTKFIALGAFAAIALAAAAAYKLGALKGIITR